MRRTRTAALLLAAASTALAGVATAGSGVRHVIRQQAGPVGATLSYDVEAGRPGNGDVRLAVTLRGGVVFNRRICAPRISCWIVSRRPLQLRQLAPGPRTVFIDMFSGGAHCCFFSEVVTIRDGRVRAAFRQEWGQIGYRYARVGSGPVLISADSRFSYAFGAFAWSRFPVQVWRLSGRADRLVTVTRTVPMIVRRDAAKRWAEYLRSRGQQGVDVRGMIAAWCADEYLLDQGPTCEKRLREALAAGFLHGDTPGAGPENAAFVTALHRDLRAWGYMT